MDDLITWLRAQLDEDERMAQAAGDAVVGWIASETANNGEPEVGLHIKRWRPARVLAEVEAKRLIVERSVLYGRDLVKLLALPYADRSGYREEWRP